MSLEIGKARIMFTMNEREMLEGEVEVFLEHDGEWKFRRSLVLQTGWTGLSEPEMVAMFSRGERPEIHTIDIPISDLPGYVDPQLRQMGWRRTSDLHSWPAMEPTVYASSLNRTAPNRIAECSIRRGWRERQYMRGISAALREQERRSR